MSPAPCCHEGHRERMDVAPSTSSRASPRVRLCPNLRRQPARGRAVLAQALGWERWVK